MNLGQVSSEEDLMSVWGDMKEVVGLSPVLWEHMFTSKSLVQLAQAGTLAGTQQRNHGLDEKGD